MKTIQYNIKKTLSVSNKDNSTDDKKDKMREVIKNIKNNDLSCNVNNILNNHDAQCVLINKLYLVDSSINTEFKAFILRELRNKINSYKTQDIKKDFHEIENLITLDEVIEKLVTSKLKCYYCNLNIFFIFEKIRENKQWTLDRLNNYDEHTNQNTIISCLKCNLQRRRKNSEKFKFTKQLETNQIKISKINI